MAAKNKNDTQLMFDFLPDNQKIVFTPVKVSCRCGYSGEYKKASIVIEMTVICPKCTAVISL